MLTLCTIRTTTATRLILGVLIGLLPAPVTTRAQTEDVVYYRTDAIGSVRAMTDPTGAVIERYDFLPFGEPIPATVAETRRER